MSFTQQESLDFGRRDTIHGVGIFLLDVTVLITLLGLALTSHAWWLQAFFAVGAGIVIGILFVVAHDAAHNSLTPSRGLNHWLGQLAMLPALHPFSLWVLVHNQTHHRWTNLSPQDYVWTPLDVAAYRRLRWPQRLTYRFYRSFLGPTLYYLIEFWWKRMIFPDRREQEKRRSEYVVDRCYVLLFATAYLAMLVWGAPRGWFGGEARPLWNVLLYGAVIPFATWNTLMSFVIYLHHTHPQIKWYNDEAIWRKSDPQLETSVHVVFPGPINRIFHWIMEHNAHHIRPSIPLYRLREAQELLETREHERIVVFHWSIRSHLDVVRRCKLFDYQARRWCDFEGQYTSP